MLLSGLLWLRASDSGAAEAVIELAGPTECAPSLSALKGRLASIEQRVSAEGFRASIVIDAKDGGYRVTLATTRTDALAGETEVTAPTCDEAADVATVVLAMATGSEGSATDGAHAHAQPISATPERASLEPSRPTPARRASVKNDDRERAPLFGGAFEAVGRRRVAVALGVDAGTLSTPTLVAAAALATSFDALELRAALRYGFATVDEELDAGAAESRRSEFGALAGLACYGTSGNLRLAACGGAELGLVSNSRHVERSSGLDEDERALMPRLSGMVAAMLAHRGSRIQPELECSGSSIALGREAGAARLVLRVSGGAAIAF